jgi:2-dehydropantoate 2-reductase
MRRRSSVHNGRMRHAILGSGGVGGVLGASLAKVGEAVTMVVRAAALAEFPGKLELESPLVGNFSVPVEKSAVVPSADVLWIAVKATQMESALDSAPQAAQIGAVVPLLNGIDHVSRLRERFGHERVLPATIAGEMERIAPGRMVHPSPFLMLNIASSGQELLGGLAKKLDALHWSCRFVDDEATLLWIKLVFLGPFALATSAAGMPIGGVLDDEHWREQLDNCVREFCAVAVAEGAQVNVDKVLGAFSIVPKNMRSSMQKDVERGNPPELDAIGGPVVRGGERHEIPVPVTRGLMEAVEGRTEIVRRRA